MLLTVFNCNTWRIIWTWVRHLKFFDQHAHRTSLRNPKRPERIGSHPAGVDQSNRKAEAMRWWWFASPRCDLDCWSKLLTWNRLKHNWNILKFLESSQFHEVPVLALPTSSRPRSFQISGNEPAIHCNTTERRHRWHWPRSSKAMSNSTAWPGTAHRLYWHRCLCKHWRSKNLSYYSWVSSNMYAKQIKTASIKHHKTRFHSHHFFLQIAISPFHHWPGLCVEVVARPGSALAPKGGCPGQNLKTCATCAQ